jgi:hypothetical protein
MKKMFLFKFGKIFVKPVHGKPVSKMSEIKKGIFLYKPV